MLIGIFHKRWDRLKRDKKKFCNVLVSITIIQKYNILFEETSMHVVHVCT